jgi:hypothetical protein
MEPVPPAWPKAKLAANNSAKQYATWRMPTPPSVRKNVSLNVRARHKQSNRKAMFHCTKH